jgi:hypothetical protein
MLHDRDFAAFTGEHCTCEIRVQLRPGSGHWGRDDTHLSRLLPPVWMIAGPGSRNDFSDRIQSSLTLTVRTGPKLKRDVLAAQERYDRFALHGMIPDDLVK